MAMERTPYDAFAEVYEQHWENFAVLISPWFLQVLRRFGAAPRSVVDLACGTGRFALFLAAKGFRVTGIDRSDPMLAVARRRSAEQGADVTWLCQDMREFVVPEHVDCVTCWFDSLNYLTRTSDVAATFGRAFDALSAGGVFLFDVNTIRGLSERWNTETRIDVNTSEHFVVTDTAWNPEDQCNTLVLHGFLRRGERYERIYEEHVQRAYPLDELRGLLEEAGFADVHVFGRRNFEEVDEEAYRAYFFARKPGQ